METLHSPAHGMPLKDILAENLARLMAHYCDVHGHRPSINYWTSGLGLDSKVITRATGARGLTVSSIEQVAQVAHIEPWQLLVEGFDPLSPPMLVGPRSAAGADLARILDRIKDPVIREAAYAMASRVLERSCESDPSSEGYAPFIAP